ncbi:MAG TPA: hypothetical protein VGT41_01520 [Candidatus Babeliales bacterium]|nr:hypothetical protein [Candidatus Babeliales bacterium]
MDKFSKKRVLLLLAAISLPCTMSSYAPFFLKKDLQTNPKEHPTENVDATDKKDLIAALAKMTANGEIAFPSAIFLSSSINNYV